MSLHLLTSAFSFKVFIFFVILIIFLIGLIDYTLISEANRCQMTYMFQIPQFIHIPLSNHINRKFPNYNLYAYGEGEYAQTLRLGELNGVPVVFVPGNGGSFKQVRSLGSVALRMTHRYLYSVHLNYFTLDFNEELSGVNSYQLQSQTEYLKEAVIKIVNLYKKSRRNASLVLIGHSIGGLIIRALFTLPEFKHYLNNIDVIITLATPHKSPVLPIDSQMTSFYEKVENYWRLNRNSQLSHINVISIGGGFSDKLVRSDLTKLQDDFVNDLSIITTSIDDVWVSTDHLCIVWCKQLVIKLTRLIFDLVDENSLEIIKNNSERNEIIRYHLMGRTLGKNYPKVLIAGNKTLSAVGDWNESRDRLIRIVKPKVLNPSYILLPLVRRESIVIQIEGTYRYDWIMACNATKSNNVTICEKGMNLHSYVKLMPSDPHDTERRVFKSASSTFLNMGFSHLILAISSSIHPVNIMTDRFTTVIRSRTIVMPTLLQSITMLFSPVTILNIPVSEQTTFYNLSLVGLEQIWNTYWVNLETLSCYQTATNIGYLYFTIPWSRENQFRYVYPKRGKNAHITLKVNTPKPKDFSSDKQPLLYLILEPDCGYKLHLKPSLSEIMGQIMRHFGVILLPIIVSILLSILSIQLNASIVQTNSEINSDNCVNNNFFSGQPKYCYRQPIIIMKSIKSVSMYGLLVLSSASFALFSNYFEKNSITSGLTYAQVTVLYIVLYSIAYSITYFFLLFITCTFTALSYCLNFLESKIFASRAKQTKEPVENPRKSLRLKRISLFCLIFLFVPGITFVSSLTFLIGLVLHNIQLICLSKKCQRMHARKGDDSDSSLWHLHLTILALLYFLIIPTIPMLLDWLNLKMQIFHFGLADRHLIPALSISFSCAVFWQQFSVVNIKILERKLLSLTLKAIAILSSICCQINYSTISQTITISFLIVSVHQLSEWYRNRHLKLD